ncbi:zinc finger MYM-type protein 4-like isoform X1 [Anabas testudineus]|uniref:TRASH domain-containing protein n=1 Tax=Anabas testudineus TaxID=64144 RepID=A0A3Q1HGW8_ANATE|nr:zinc finger MYM-type protein 4-like isoform X1 [Anabas testudineus]
MNCSPRWRRTTLKPVTARKTTWKLKVLFTRAILETRPTPLRDATCKGVSFSKDSSSTKKQASPLKKPGRGRTGKWDSEGEEAELSDENHDEVNSEREDRTEDVPVKRAKETPTQSKEETAICFSDDDDDMHVDFDIDIDTDEDVRNEGNNEDGHSADSATATPMRTDMKGTTNQNTDISEGDKEEDSPDEDCGDVEDTMESDIENDVDEEDQETRGEQMDRMDVDSSSSDAMLSTEKKKKLSAAVTGMREVKILIPKLDIEKVKAPVHISELSSLFSKWPVKDQLVWNDDNKRKTSTHINNKPSDAKDVEMTCSNCKKTMMKGQTAYQKKGFTDVFCSKICLFEKFPVNKPASKTCHYCLKEITQLLNLIMAVVDIKGTMKDFCGLTCLTTFKFNTVSTQSLCSTCNKSCTTTLELILNEVVHKFCSDSCLAGFRRDNVALCENCDSPCHKKLMLKLEEDTKTFCSGACVEEYKKNINTAHSCPMCHTSVPVSRMFVYKTSEDTVELFCHRPCATSYKLGCEIIHKLQETKGSAQKKKNKRSKQNSNTEDVNVGSDSTANENDASPAAASDTTPTPITADSRVSCCNCGKELQEGETIYQLKSSQEFFCSASCVSERHNITVAVKSCYNCFQEIKRPQNIISAPVDNSGTIKELCSETCLASVQSKRRMTASKPSPTLGPRSECRMCVRYCYCKFKLTLDGVVHRLCSNSCFISYHKVNNLPLLMCEVCSSVDLPMRLTLKMWDGSKNVCSEKCLIKFKEKVQTPELCPMCQTFHQLSDMVENKNEDGSLNFFCSNRCMMVYKVPSFTASEKSKPSPEEEDDIKEVKPPLPKLDCTKVKEEPIDDEYKQNLPPLVSTQDVKEEPNVAQEDLKIGSVFSLTGDPTPAAPTLTRMDLPASCSSCKEVLRNGETVYQRKGHTDVFCSTSCLMKFYQMKAAKKTCHFCLEVITQPQDAVQAQLDDEETVKDFCSQSCLSSFNYKTFVSTKIPIVPVGSHSQCSICGRYCISKHEVIQQDTVHKICSESCFRRFRNMNNLSISQNNQSPCSTPHTLKMEDGNRKLCSEKCLAQCKEKSQAQQPCSMCSTSNQVSEIVKNNNSDNTVENCCTNSCVMESKPVSATAAAKSSPVIANVVSLASALSRHSSSSTARQGSLPDIHTKVVGHASIQTAPKEVKNKSTLCTPLVHNKGVSCTTQTVDKEAQTDKFFPKVIVLPVPVPVYVPLPMNMYSQYTPKPVGLPLPLPVPMFIPVTSAGPEPQVKTGDERIQPETLEEKLEAQMETKQDDRNEREDEQEAREVTKGGGGEETKAYTEHTRSCCHDVNKDLDSLNIQESSSSDSNLRSHSRPHPHMKPPPVSDSNMPSEPQPELPQPTPPHPHSSQSPAPSPLPSQQSLVKAHNKNKDRKLKLSKAAKEDTAPQDVSKGTSRRPRKLKIQRGLEAWKRWIHRRESQTNMDPGSPHAVKLKENILHCSASELNDGLCLFIREVKRSNGEPYSSDSLFYLCLSIQQYLFDSGRMENIFSDQIYSKFSTEFTNILKHQKFSVTARGYVHSRVEEEYLWDCKQLGAYSPIVLLNTLLFFCCKYFGLTTVEQNRQLSFSQVILCTKTNPNNIRTTFLRFHPSVSMNESDGVPAKKRKKNVNKEEILEVMENTENPLRCPVRLYEFYISKCGELVKQRSDSFYLQPDRCCVPSSDLWFSSTPLDCSIMEAMLERILTVREIEERH